MLAACLHPMGRHRPDLLVEVDFTPAHAEDFAGASGGKDAQFKCQRSESLTPAKVRYKRCYLVVRHRGVMPARQFRWPGQQVIQVATPPGRVFALSESLGLGGVQDLFDPSAHAGGGFGFRRPDRL